VGHLESPRINGPSPSPEGQPQSSVNQALEWSFRAFYDVMGDLLIKWFSRSVHSSLLLSYRDPDPDLRTGLFGSPVGHRATRLPTGISLQRRAKHPSSYSPHLSRTTRLARHVVIGMLSEYHRWLWERGLFFFASI